MMVRCDGGAWLQHRGTASLSCPLLHLPDEEYMEDDEDEEDGEEKVKA
jgi:hypothetical protein